MAAKGLLRALGEELRARRKEKNWSQELLAEKAKLHRNFIGFLERGQRNPTLETISELASALKISISELISGAEKRL